MDFYKCYCFIDSVDNIFFDFEGYFILKELSYDIVKDLIGIFWGVSWDGEMYIAI